MNKSILILIILSIIIGIFIGWGIKPKAKCPEPQVITDTVITYVTLKDTLTVKKFLTKRDTIFIKELDTFYIKTEYIANADTTYQDSLLQADISFISDIPLSKNSFFDLRFKLKQKEIIKTVFVEKEPSFWYKRFIPYLGVGLSLTQENKIEPSIQLGIGIRLN